MVKTALLFASALAIYYACQDTIYFYKRDGELSGIFPIVLMAVAFILILLLM